MTAGNTGPAVAAHDAASPAAPPRAGLVLAVLILVAVVANRPLAVLMVLTAPLSAKLVETRDARLTLLTATRASSSAS
jgi:hypothetical protein